MEGRGQGWWVERSRAVGRGVRVVMYRGQRWWVEGLRVMVEGSMVVGKGLMVVGREVKGGG